ncbi:hypothetical protein BaRGS_00015728 [Batillaria attramentaria]|uniref:Uncharacterized protein n=1 Tax=Batillaria attramentaria TaxID=370345 RepID=A0ABD0L0F7_9CAEN
MGVLRVMYRASCGADTGPLKRPLGRSCGENWSPSDTHFSSPCGFASCHSEELGRVFFGRRISSIQGQIVSASLFRSAGCMGVEEDQEMAVEGDEQYSEAMCRRTEKQINYYLLSVRK